MVAGKSRRIGRNYQATSANAQLVEVPRFDENCHGKPCDWNDDGRKLFWGRRAYRHFNMGSVAETEVDIGNVFQFLSLRRGRNVRPISELLGSPEPMDDGWFRCSWVGFHEEQLPRETLGKYGQGQADWHRAWHGCKLEALYCIMYAGHLTASYDKENGERFLRDKPGVYVHKDSTKHKAENYTRFVELCNDGVLWCAMWEVRVDRSDRVPAGNTDQWVQEERSVRLAALWLCGRKYSDMKCGSEVSAVWDPLLEGNPYKARSALKNTRRRALGSDYATTEAALAPQHAAEVIMTRASKRKKEIVCKESIAVCGVNAFAQELKRQRGSITSQVDHQCMWEGQVMEKCSGASEGDAAERLAAKRDHVQQDHQCTWEDQAVEERHGVPGGDAEGRLSAKCNPLT